MINSSVTRPGKSGGFSLVELMIVLAGAAILLAAAGPNIAKLHKEWALWGGTRIMEASLQWGRMHAIASNTPVIFEVDEISRRFYWVDAVSGDRYENSIRQLPVGVRIAEKPKRSLRFYQHGNAAPAGTYRIEGDAGSYSVVVSPGGRIRVQRD